MNTKAVYDERILKSKRIPDLEGSDVWRSKVSNANAFRMVDFALRKVYEEEMFTRMQIEFTAENITIFNIRFFVCSCDRFYWGLSGILVS